MKQSLSSISAKALALASIAASIALTAHALPAKAAAESRAVTVYGAVAPVTGTEALALGAIQWQYLPASTQGAMPVSTVSLQVLERVGADLSNANTGVLPVMSVAAPEPGVVASVTESVVKSDQADDVLLEPAYSALVAAMGTEVPQS